MPNETKPNMGNTSTPPTETSAGPQPGKSKRPVVLVMAKNCAVGGKPIKEGAKLAVGKDINEADAKALLKMGRAELEEGDKK